MGGDTSREKRKLKRIQAAGKSPAGTSSVPITEISNGSPSQTIERSNATATSNEKAQSGQVSSSNAVLRLRRKLERKAAGKFKLASVEKSSSDSSKKQPTIRKRKSGEHENPVFKRPKNNDAQDNRSSSNNGKKIHVKKKTPTKETPKKRNNAKKKPKHLNRKMAQLSKSIVDGGGNIADLEAQMNKLKEQIEMMKSMKGDATESARSNDGGKTVDDEETKDILVESEDINDENSASSSSSSCSDQDDSSSNKKAQTSTRSKDESSSSSSSSSDDDASDEEIKEENPRSRGKRRRGRREKAVVEKKNEEVNSSESINIKPNECRTKDDVQDPTEEATTQTKKKTSKKDDNRRCIGRKPVTDYSVGQKYSGKVKYIKSTLGAFIDIGSHSDAFCHISCISDGYAENVEEVVNVGDDVEARVVEVNREKKRITVSLRSDEMAQIEQDKLAAKQKKFAPKNDKTSGHTRFDSNLDSDKKSSQTRAGDLSEKQMNKEKGNHIGYDLFNAHSDQKKWEIGTSKASQASSSGPKTGADLKRERKLARRAERRAQQMVAE